MRFYLKHELKILLKSLLHKKKKFTNMLQSYC